MSHANVLHDIVYIVHNCVIISCFITHKLKSAVLQRVEKMKGFQCLRWALKEWGPREPIPL